MQDEPVQINSKSYWDKRFGSGDWEAKGGFSQTRLFAESQIIHLNIEKEFSGTICDFGCGAGDAFPVYRYQYPNAKLIGVDFSEDAIRLCVERYGDIANFYCAEAKDIPPSDVIICSNVLEHIVDYTAVMRNLIARCKLLYVIVPYRESPLCSEHVRHYDEKSFSEFRPRSKTVFLSKGWSQYGINLWYGVYFKNILRAAVGRPLVRQGKQIIFEFSM